MPLDGFDLLTVTQVCAILHCSKAHVTNLAAGKVHGCSRLPVVRLGRRLLVRPQSFLEWTEQNEAANDNLKASPETGLERLKRSV
jgi:helix-turn-helix protein